jgi:hypothetical protein
MNEKKPGRPKMAPEQHKTQVGVVLSKEQAAKFRGLGGSRFLQRIIDAVCPTKQNSAKGA